MKSRHSIINRLMSRFSYSEKFIFISLMFALSILTLSALMIRDEEIEIDFVNNELAGSLYVRPLRQLLEDVPKHKFVTHRYLHGNLGLKSEMVALESQINNDLQKLKAIDDSLGDSLQTHENPYYQEGQNNFLPKELERVWTDIRNQSQENSAETSDTLHNDLITRIHNLTSYIQDESELILDSVLTTHYLTNMALTRLPEFQETLSQMIALGEDIVEQKKMNDDQQSKLIALSNLLKLQLDGIKKSALKAVKTHDENSKVDRIAIESQLNGLMVSTDDFLRLIDHKILNKDTKELILTPNDFIAAGESVYESSFKLWDMAIDQFDELLTARKHRLKLKQLIGLTVAISLGLIGFLVGLFIMRQISIPLNHLTEATRRLAGGDLSARVQISYQDEIGRVGIAFNNMAQSFQTIIGQLRELLEAIKKLANGNFSARVSVANPNDEIGQVGYSFNNMAQSFEEIISQLHQLGINLTTSATEIAAASKEQETIIMEQEATTREISVTANEISTTAKEFATTVFEVSKAAEYTSGLAAGGKHSLSHMESIMRQMVDASGNIASKLAVLNEKAGNITSVITTITKVADQTNLLSLNASIEAEKAGEYGRSFAVIAREIRRLADQTALATLDIEKIVNEIMSAVSTSVMGVDDFTQEIRAGVEQAGTVGGQLTKIIEQVEALTARFESVNQGMQTQSAAAEQINDAISQLSQTAQQTTESIHQFRNTIQQLNSAATDLRVAVSKMKK